MMYAILGEIMNVPVIIALACVCLALIGLYLMAAEFALGQTSRIWSGGLLLVALAYAAANAGVFVATVSRDAFDIFELPYVISIAFVGPALTMLALVIISRMYERPGRRSVTGFVIWVLCVAVAHLYVIAAASASV